MKFLILSNQKKSAFSELEQYALNILATKLLANELTDDEKMILVNEVISEYLEFDAMTDEPINETLKLEDMIDFLIAN